MHRSEIDCERVFRKMGQVFNANTPENHPAIWLTEDDLKAGVSILAISVKMFGSVRVYAFQLMSNHIHLVIGGNADDIKRFFAFFVERLDKYFNYRVDLSGFELKLFPVGDLSYFRNAIAYVNRNGFVVNNDATPFSYPWGSSRYFFQPMSLSYDKLAGKPIGVVTLRALLHTRKCDHLKNVREVDGFVSPLEFCDINTAQMAFRDAKQYFYAISRNVETYSEVARSIGEAVFYNDNDLYIAAVKLAKDHYGMLDLRALPAEAKIDIAKRLHYDYYAGDKQLQRILNIESIVLKGLF